MKMDKVNVLFQELKSNKELYYPKEQKLREMIEVCKDLSNDETLNLLNLLVDDDIFRWLPFICIKVCDTASVDKDFISFLKKIIEKIKYDMAQGPFIDALIYIGKEKDFALDLFDNIKKTRDKDMILYGGVILGGYGQEHFEDLFKNVVEDFDTKDDCVKAAFIRSLRISHENKESILEEGVFKILENEMEIEDLTLKTEILLAYLNFYKFNRTICFNNIIKLIKRHRDPILRINLIRKIYTSNLDSKDSIELLKICSKDDDENVLKEIGYPLINYSKTYSREVFNILKDWIKRDKYFNLDFDYILESIGKENAKIFLDMVEEWIDEERNPETMRFFPIILNKLSSDNYNILIQTLHKWFEKEDSKFDEIIISTTKEFLGSIYGSYKTFKKEISTCSSLLENLVKRRRVSIPTKRSNGDIKYCFYLIDELQAKRKDLNFDKIKINLENYPNIKEFIDEKWFDKKQKENNKTHPLLIFLSRTPDFKKIKELKEKLTYTKEPLKQFALTVHIQNLLYPSAFLKHLDKMLSLIKRNEKGTKGLRKGLADENKFWPTISEIETIYLLREKYGIKNVEIEPEIKINDSGNIVSKYLDCKVRTTHTSFLIEVVNPDLMDLLKYNNRVVKIKNRAIDIIYDEFKKKHRIKEAMNIHDNPLIFVMDIGRSEIDKDFIESTFKGSPKMTLVFDKKIRKTVAKYPSRAKDSLYYKDMSTSMIFGVLYYKREMNSQGEIYLCRSLVLNPYSGYLKDSNAVGDVNKTIEGKSK